MTKRVIDTALPKAGPYSHAVAAGGLVFVSGQIGFSPSDGKIVDGGIGPQLRQALENASNILADAGLQLSDVVKVTLYLTDLSQFSSVNEVFGESFPSDPPARTTVQVSALPMGAQVELDLIAAIPAG